MMLSTGRGNTSRASAEMVARAVVLLTRPALARKSFAHFVPATMPSYQMALHHELIAGALQLVEDGIIRFLAISIPPRHGKSELVSVRFPAFYLGRHPDEDVIHVSYGSDLSNDFSRRVRALVRDDLMFRMLFPGVELDPERQRVNDWRLVNGGGFRSVGTGGGVSGHGANLLVIDDPHKEGEITPTNLQQVYDWYTSAARLRLMPGGKVVLCMTRWDLLDLEGRVLRAANESAEADQWWVLTLPGLAGEDDPMGRAPGEALWPEWYTREDLLAIKALSEAHFEALIQQNPRAFALMMFDENAWRRVDAVDEGGRRFAWCFDLALGETEASDYTAWARASYDEVSGVIAFGRLFRERLTWPEARARIVELMRLHPDEDFVFPRHILEQMAVQELRYEVDGARLRQVVFPTHGDKRSRAQVLADRLPKGKVVIEEGPLAQVWINEHRDFPGEHDDVVDVGSVATHWFGLNEEFSAAILDLERKARLRAVERAAQDVALAGMGVRHAFAH